MCVLIEGGKPEGGRRNDRSRDPRAPHPAGRLRNGVVVFKVSSCNGFTGEHRDYKGQVGVFLVWCPELNSVYEVPVAAGGKQQMSLRIERTKNGQAAYVRHAAKYLVPAAGVEPALSLYESAALTVELGGPGLDRNADAMRALL